MNILCRILAESFTGNGNDRDKVHNEEDKNNNPFHFTSSASQESSNSNNNGLDSIGRRKQVQYFIDPMSGKARRPKTQQKGIPRLTSAAARYSSELIGEEANLRNIW
jgi:hypothetical protein